MIGIVNEFGKFICNRLPLGMFAPGDIFQAKSDKLLSNIECIKTYHDNIFVLIKESFSKHVYQTRVILARLRTPGLKPKKYNYIFVLKDIT